jgi:hypothetical protein
MSLHGIHTAAMSPAKKYCTYGELYRFLTASCTFLNNVLASARDRAE